MFLHFITIKVFSCLNTQASRVSARTRANPRCTHPVVLSLCDLCEPVPADALEMVWENARYLCWRHLLLYYPIEAYCGNQATARAIDEEKWRHLLTCDRIGSEGYAHMNRGRTHGHTSLRNTLPIIIVPPSQLCRR